MNDEEILSRCSLFEGMDEDSLDMMLGCLGTRTSFYKKNDVLLAEGEPARRVGVLLSGRLELGRSDAQGNRSIRIQVCFRSAVKAEGAGNRRGKIGDGAGREMLAVVIPAGLIAVG